MTWIKANWIKLAGVVLTALVAANAVFGFMSTDALATILMIAGGLGVHTVSSGQQATHAKLDDAHLKLDALIEPLCSDPTQTPHETRFPRA